MIKTILADDHKLFCDGLEKVLNDCGHFQVIEKFYNGQTLLEKLSIHQPDLVVIDVEMPTLNGFDSIKRIRLNNAMTKIAVLSMHEETVFSQEAYALGANAYLSKSMESMQLIDSLLRVCNGEKIFPPASVLIRNETPRTLR